MSAVAESPLRVGLVHNWPGAKNSELDLILRLGRVLRALGHDVLIMDPVGSTLDEQGERTGTPAHPPAVDLLVNLHYLNPSYLPGVSYVVNWNPMEYLVNDPITRQPLPIKQLAFTVDCLRTHDRVLSAGSKAVDEYARLARAGVSRPWISDTDLYLHTTIESQAEHADRPGSAFKVFYIGINWEKMSADPEKRVRHPGLLELLDASGRFEFYGLSEQAGVPLWDGIASYRGELPFDGGLSIVEKCRECGAALVLSSDQHRSSGVVSTRIFQATAAGAVIIADRNPFIEEHFGDSVLYFDYADSVAETAKNILDCVGWIDANWEQARGKAEVARKVFEKNFALEREVYRLCEQARTDLAARVRHAEELRTRRVRLVYRSAEFDREQFERFVRNVHRQTHDNLVITILAPRDALRKYVAAVKSTCLAATTECVASERDRPLGSLLARIVEGTADFLIVYSEGFEWREDHVFCLLSAVEQEGADLSHSPFFREDPSLKTGADMMAFFIHGMNGGFRHVTASMFSRFEMSVLPLGNILWRRATALRLERESGYLAQFDVGGVYALMLRCWLDSGKLPVSVSAITSSYVGAGAAAENWTYDEYSSPAVPAHARQRDRNAFYAFFRYLAGTRTAIDFDEILASWEYEQVGRDVSLGTRLVGSRAELLHEVARMRESYPGGARPMLGGHLVRLRGDIRHRVRVILVRSPRLYRTALAVRRLLGGK